MPVISEGIMAVKTARPTTIGVYHLANLVIKFSDLDFLLVAFSISSKILETVLSSKLVVTLTLMIPSLLIEPLRTSLPSLTKTGTASPVSIEVSNELVPSTMTPSNGSFSPTLTSRISPILTS